MAKQDAKDKWTYIGGIVVIIVLLGLCAVWYDTGYRAGIQDTERDIEQEPTPFRVSMAVISLSASQYNQTWYDVGSRCLDVSEELLRSPTLRNDNFRIMIDVHYGSSVICVQQFGAPIPHANITVEVLSFGGGLHNFTIERVAILGHNRTETRKIINLCDNEPGRMCATDWVRMAFFGYGGWNSEMVFWVLQSTMLTVGPVWYEEAAPWT